MGQAWQPGEPFLLRNVRQGIVRYAIPAVAVEDSGDRLAFLVREPTPAMGYRGNEPRDFVHADHHEPFTWAGHDVLWCVRPEDWFQVGVFWRHADGAFLGYYVNLQEPMRRTRLGIDTMDKTLDMQIHPNRRDWQWKDEDEFAYGIEHGWYTEADLEHLRAEGLRALARAAAGDWPFDRDWAAWTPPQDWPIPTLHEDWGVLDLAPSLGDSRSFAT